MQPPPPGPPPPGPHPARGAGLPPVGSGPLGAPLPGGPRPAPPPAGVGFPPRVERAFLVPPLLAPPRRPHPPPRGPLPFPAVAHVLGDVRDPRAGRRQRVPRLVVDQLGVDVLGGAEHRQ